MTTLPLFAKFGVVLFSTLWLFLNTAGAQDPCSSKVPECTDKFEKLDSDVFELSANFRQFERDSNYKIDQQKSSIAMLNQTLRNQTNGMSNQQSGFKYNIAERKPTNQCSVYNGAVSARAVDNAWQSQYDGGSCSHTKKERSPWWYVDLQDRYTIYSVVIQNRKDCCWHRLDGANIFVGDSLSAQEMHMCGTFRGPSFAGEIREIKCFPPVTGRYLQIRLPGTQYLTLCEVAVYDAFKHD